MESNKNKKLNVEHNPWIIWIPILLVLGLVAVGVVKFYVWGNSISEDVKNNKIAYVPSDKDGNGFIGKTNRLLEYLLDIQDPTITKVNSVETLNKRYPALIFTVPYEIITDSTEMLVEDIRLIGINDTCIKDAELYEFYQNSSLESVLAKQKNDIAKKVFKITFKGTSISSITIIPTMFKVLLHNDVFKSAIMCKENSLFMGTEEEPVYYLVSGETVLPIKRRGYIGQYYDVELYGRDGNFTKAGDPIGYYDYYNNAFCKMKEINLFVDPDDKEKKVALYMDKVEGEAGNFDIVYLKTDGGSGINCDVLYNGKKMQKVEGSSGTNDYAPYEYNDGMVIIVRDGARKIGELSIMSKNPALIMSSMVQTNKGESRYALPTQTADLFTRQVVYGLNGTLNNENCNSDTIRLTLDPILAMEFEKEMREYLVDTYFSGGLRQGENWDMSMTIMDMATGEIIAAPYVSTITDKINNEELKLVRKGSVLNRMYIGSTFKPLLALAAVQTNHSLLDLNTEGKVFYKDEKNKIPFRFFCAKLPNSEKHVWADENTSFWSGYDFKNFISYSDDVYPVALAALAMNGYGVEENISNCADITRNMGVNGSIFREYRDSCINMKSNDARSSGDYELLQMIDLLYHVHSYEDEAINDTLSNDLWRFLPLKEDLTSENKIERNIALMSITPDVTNMHYEQFHTGHTMKGELVPWVLGQGNNYWCPLKVAEAWTRMVTKQPVRYTLVMSPNGKYIAEKPLVDQIVEKRKKWGVEETKENVNEVWNNFLNKLDSAQYQGVLLPPMYSKVCALNDNMEHSNYDDVDRLVLFSKTGTPDNYRQTIDLKLNGEPYKVDLGMYTFSLMKKGEFEKVKIGEIGEVAKGITCVIRIVYLSPVPKKPSDMQGKNLFQSKDARNFFSDDYNRLKKFYEMTKIYY